MFVVCVIYLKALTVHFNMQGLVVIEQRGHFDWVYSCKNINKKEEMAKHLKRLFQECSHTYTHGHNSCMNNSDDDRWISLSDILRAM